MECPKCEKNIEEVNIEEKRFYLGALKLLGNSIEESGEIKERRITKIYCSKCDAEITDFIKE